jgi:hypothetical protein
MKPITNEELNRLKKERQEWREKNNYISLSNYTHILKNYDNYLDFLSENMVKIINTNRFCFKNPDGSPDFSKTINDADLELDILQAGYKLKVRELRRLIKSDRMQKAVAPYEIMEKLCS